MKKTLRSVLRRFKYDLVSYDARFNSIARMQHHVRSLPISIFIDVGANIGQFGQKLRELGYCGNILSFEPLASEFTKLSRLCDKDPRWECLNVGLGASKQEVSFCRTENSVSSSILRPTEISVSSNSGTAVSREERIFVDVLDTVVRDRNLQSSSVALKIDAQGYDLEVLRGASETLLQTQLLIVELSFKEFYEGQPLAEDMLPFLRQKGFVPSVIHPCWENFANMETYQVDAWFVRET